MFCWNCRAQNDDEAVRCYNCGAELEPSVPENMAGREVPNYLVFSILVTIFCCIFAGIPAILYAAQVNTKLAQGDWTGALESSRQAKMWCWISFALGLVYPLIWITIGILMAIGVIPE